MKDYTGKEIKIGDYVAIPNKAGFNTQKVAGFTTNYVKLEYGLMNRIEPHNCIVLDKKP